MSAEDLRVETISADDENSEDRNSIYFSTIRSRHVEHFFPEPSSSSIENNQQLNGIIKYPDYDQCNPNRKGLYPNLILNRLSFSRDLRTSPDKALLRIPVLKQEFHNVNLELNPGDIMAIMYTKESEMITLLKVISGAKEVRGKLGGEILINGHRMTKDRLGKTIAFLTSETPSSSLTVKQYLYVNSSFCPPLTEKYGGTAHLINKLMSDMGLAPVSDIICSRLNRSQWQRAKTAAQLIKDPTILLCADILRDCDIQDQAFLIDYLRDWAVKTSRIVILGISPSSMELLQMFSKVLIFASGRVIYCGPPGSMLQYFESIGCPCPPFKNVCDYYVDLVTHDNLTSDASRESSIRIARLVNKWNLAAPPLIQSGNGKVLLDLASGSVFHKFFATFSLFWFDFVNNKFSRILALFFVFVISSILSFYLPDLPLSLPEAFLDRQAFLDVSLYYFPLLVGMIELKKARHRLREFEKLQVIQKCSILLFSIVTLLGSIPPTLFNTLAFTIPVTAFIDFHKNTPVFNLLNSFSTLFSIIFLILFFCEIVCQVFSTFRNDTAAFFGFAFTWTILYLTSGFPVHQFFDIPIFYKFLNPLSFNGFQLVMFVYGENPTFLDVFKFKKPTVFNKPIKLLSCGRTILNTTQITKGPCQRVSSAELQSYYFPQPPESKSLNHFTTITNKIVENYLIVVFSCVFFLVFMIFVILLYFRLSKRRN